MSETPDAPAIFVPEPEGHPRGCLVLGNGQLQACDLEPRELAETLSRFLASEEHVLELRDAQYGAPIWVTRAGAAAATMVATQWMKKPAPRGKGVSIVRAAGLPQGLS